MVHLLAGLKKFSDTVYPDKRDMFSELAKGQKPHTMFITCSDSRIDPNLVTQTDPGELFVLRNAGNIVPPYGASQGGEEAAIEFAIDGLGVQNIVVCGHTKCGAMSGLAGHVDTSGLPSTAAWLRHAAATKKVMEQETPGDLDQYIEENVLVQIQNLKTHPSVARAIKLKNLKLFGWVYRFENGDVGIFNKEHSSFISSQEIDVSYERKSEHFDL